MEPFVESEMTFGPYADGHCFRVELSQTYLAIQDKVQMAEFLLLRTQAESPPFIWIVEAKKSSPRPETQPNFNEFICEIRDKLANALAVGIASILKRHPAAAAELPELFTALNLAATGFRLVLIINGHQKSWLQVLVGRLREAIRRLNPAIPFRTLATLRDTLLPKLLSGELSVAGVEKRIAEHP